MSLVISINYFLTLFLDTVRQFTRWRIWLLLLAYFVFQWLLLLALSRFHWPVFYGFVQTWLNLIDAEKAVGFTHYPGHFMLLPHYFDLTRFYAAILIEGAVLGGASIMFYRAYFPAQTGSAGPNTSHWLYTWVQVVLAWLVLDGIFMLIYNNLPELLGSALAGAPRRAFIFTYMFQPALRILVLGLLFFAIPYTAIHGVSFLRGIFRSVRLFLKYPVTCLFLSAVISVGPIAVQAGLRNPARIIEIFRPETIYWTLLAGLVMNIIVHFFWIGTAVRRLIDRE